MPKREAPRAVAVSVKAPAAHWIELAVAGGVCRWHVRPLSAQITEAAKFAANQDVRAARLAHEDLRRMGAAPDPEAVPIDDPRAAFGLWQSCYLRHAARLAVFEWADMVDAESGDPLPFSLEALDAVMRIPEFAVAFDGAYLVPTRVRSAEKNGSRPAPRGSTGAGRTPATPAEQPTTSPTSSPVSETPAPSSTATGPVA